MQTARTSYSNIEAADKEVLAKLSERRKAAIATLIAAGEVTSAQHAMFMAATGLLKLPE